MFRWRYCYLSIVLHLGVLVHVGWSWILFAVEVREVVGHVPHRFLKLYLGTGQHSIFEFEASNKNYLN